MRTSKATEAQVAYVAAPDPADLKRQREDATIRHALSILERRMRAPGELLGSPEAAGSYLRLSIGAREHEVFVVLFLDVKNRVVASEEMFRGSLTQTSVHPREVVKTALRHNANSVLLSHNHPSGTPDPSEADLHMTRAVREALALVDVRVLDHIIVTASSSYSFAEHGQL
jgi:DNA repair protein RadC